jgi:hypothetical protein
MKILAMPVSDISILHWYTLTIYISNVPTDARSGEAERRREGGGAAALRSIRDPDYRVRQVHPQAFGDRRGAKTAVASEFACAHESAARNLGGASSVNSPIPPELP